MPTRVSSCWPVIDHRPAAHKFEWLWVQILPAFISSPSFFFSIFLSVACPKQVRRSGSTLLIFHPTKCILSWAAWGETAYSEQTQWTKKIHETKWIFFLYLGNGTKSFLMFSSNPSQPSFYAESSFKYNRAKNFRWGLVRQTTAAFAIEW